ncbi:SPASM domain-containing protein [Anaerolineales bacterium HSG25]|nr:SPASM domain-containing protein [Anaerolineales bacterium HSG25]
MALLWETSNTQRDHNSDCDCEDCACVDYNLTLRTSLATRNNSSWHRPPHLYQTHLHNGHNLAFNPHGPVGVVVLDKQAHTALNMFGHPAPLVTELDRQLAHVGLIEPVDTQTIPHYTDKASCHSGKATLTAWLHITDRCNLRCRYCYLPHHKVDMTIETGQVAISATFRSAVKHNYKAVKLKYSGGEAMLRFPLIKQLHQYAQQLADQHGLTLEGVILSNGTLLKSEIIEQIQQLDLRLMISLDGLGIYQDQQRFYAGSKGTSADVMNSIKLALSFGLRPYISITVTGQSAAGLPELITWVLQHDLPFSLNFYRENELSASHVDLQLEEHKIIEGMVAAFKVIEDNLPRRSLLGSLVDRANLSAPHVKTCSVGQSYLVFDHQGHVSKCQMYQEQSVTTAQTDDPLALIRADQIGIQNLSVEEKEGCRDCEWKYWCTGGCPIATYRVTGRYDVQSPNCNIYKALYPEALRLEGLRLLKWGVQHVHDEYKIGV